jgi:hypothetical protein
MSEITLRDGRPEDWSALRLLLPDAVRAGAEVKTVVAVDADARIHAALAVRTRMRRVPLPGFHVAVHVTPPARDLHLDQALLDALTPWARSQNANAFYAWGAIEAGSADEGAWRRLGFDHSVTIHEGSINPADALANLNPFWEKIVARGWLPSEAKMQSLAPEHIATIIGLHTANFGGDPAALRAQFTPESPTAIDPFLVPVLTLKGVPIAYALSEITGPATAHIHAIAVAPEHRAGMRQRAGWANLWLKREGMLRLQVLKVTRCTFHTFEQHGDTRRFSDKVGETTRTLVEPYRILP